MIQKTLICIFLLFGAELAYANQCAEVFRRKSLSSRVQDVVMGRAGNGVYAVKLGDRIVEIDRNTFDEKTYWKNGGEGIDFLTRERVLIPKGTRYFLSYQLYEWGLSTERLSYTDWSIEKKVPFSFFWYLLKERKKIQAEGETYLAETPRIFRHVFMPYLRKLVKRGGKVHFNLSHEDEAFLNELRLLSESERLKEISALRSSYLKSDITEEEGALTRLELLTVVTDHKLFSATIFYRNYSNEPVSQPESDQFWLGGRQP